QRKLNIVRVIREAFVRSRKVRCLDLVKVEDLFCERLVLRKIKSLRTTTGIRKLQQLQEGGDVLVHRVVPCIRLRQIEHEVRTTPCQRKQRLVLAVEQVIRRLVPQLCQGLEDLF